MSCKYKNMLQVSKFRISNLTYCVCKEIYKRNISLSFAFVNNRDRKIIFKNSDVQSGLDKQIEKYEPKLLYNSVIEQKSLRFGYKINNIIVSKLSKSQNELKMKVQAQEPIPLALKYVYDDIGCSTSERSADKLNGTVETEEAKVTQFPFQTDVASVEENNEVEAVKTTNVDQAKAADEEVRYRNELAKDTQNWMSSYDNYQEDLNAVDDVTVANGEEINYGTPDPNCNVSNVPCGGCGALLHCKDKSIPGYIPSEIFKNFKSQGGSNLEAIICQRCYFLKNHNLALQVRVTPEDYPKVLERISKKKALVVLMVDLLDFPCSIWPGIADIFGSKTPVVVVGNKVDLLPQDSRSYLERIKKTLLASVRESGFTTFNIRHVALISAKTGYGIEELITQLQSIWKHQGDVYLVGCTNVGKSSLFNALLQSDYCKSEASDLIQRATISTWPGTTLNLLKFPILRPSGHRTFLRHERLKLAAKTYNTESKFRREQLRLTKNPEFATLVGHVDRTFLTKNYVDFEKDAFQVNCHSNASGKLKLGIDEHDERYALSRWCFDTPGVVQPDQIVHLLTTDELMLTLPKSLIRGRTFCVKPGTSLFIGGLARLDYLEGQTSIRLTVFCSNDLPITLCYLDEAEKLYGELLGTEFFKVPTNDPERLSRWPGLEVAKSFTLTGIDYEVSCKDVVLSNAGWVAISGGHEKEYKFQAWTPEKRGVYIRDCLLPFGVTLRGGRIRNTPAYRRNKFYFK